MTREPGARGFSVRGPARVDSIARVEPPEQGFYAKRLEYDGSLIKTPAVVDQALLEGKARLERMLGKLPEVRACRRQAGARPAPGPDGLRKYDQEGYTLLDDFYSGRLTLAGTGSAVAATTSPAVPAGKVDYPIQPVPFTAVQLAPGFWQARLETNRTATIPHVFDECEKTGRVSNFERAGRPEKGKFEGFFFNDSDLFKAMEAAFNPQVPGLAYAHRGDQLFVNLFLAGIGECRLPQSWRLLYRLMGEWKPVPNPSGFGCEGNRCNRTTFDPVETDALRIEVQLQPNWAGGIHEWRVEGRP